MKPKPNGCLHFHVKNGKIIAAIGHIGRMHIPKNGIIHAKIDSIQTVDEFKESHPKEVEDGELNSTGINLKIYGSEKLR